MKKPDDDLKLDINEIFGGDWTEGVKAPSEPELPSPPPSVLPESIDESSSDIKFNDDVSAPVTEPVVITVMSKVHRSTSGSSREETVPESEEKTGKDTAGDSALVIRQPGTSGKTSDPSSGSIAPSIIMKPGVSARKEPTFEEFLAAYDRFRLIFTEELKNSIDNRKISMMFVKTFEAARERHLDVLRNSNWDASGNLLEDGSLNIQRVTDNKNSLDPKQADVLVDNALLFLFNLRIQAVEKGLGPEYGVRIKSQIRKWIETESEKNGFGKNDPKVFQHLSNFLL